MRRDAIAQQERPCSPYVSFLSLRCGNICTLKSAAEKSHCRQRSFFEEAASTYIPKILTTHFASPPSLRALT